MAGRPFDSPVGGRLHDPDALFREDAKQQVEAIALDAELAPARLGVRVGTPRHGERGGPGGVGDEPAVIAERDGERARGASKRLTLPALVEPRVDFGVDPLEASEHAGPNIVFAATILRARRISPAATSSGVTTIASNWTCTPRDGKFPVYVR
jgi:hypothetical protein